MVTCSSHTGSGHHWPWYTDHHTLVGLNTLHISYIEYSGWLGVPLGPAVWWSVYWNHGGHFQYGHL